MKRLKRLSTYVVGGAEKTTALTLNVGNVVTRAVGIDGIISDVTKLTRKVGLDPLTNIFSDNERDDSENQYQEETEEILKCPHPLPKYFITKFKVLLFISVSLHYYNSNYLFTFSFSA
jgi:hypothetical protein